MIALIQPCDDYEAEILKFKKEYLESEHKHPECREHIALEGCGGLERYDSFHEWLEHLSSYADRATFEPGCSMVEGSQWMLVDEDRHRVLGMVNLRHYLNEKLERTSGHAGYSIRPSERQKGYGKLQLKMALDILRQKGVKRALLTCDFDNAASYRTIESCGGVLEGIVYVEEFQCDTRRYWIDL